MSDAKGGGCVETRRIKPLGARFWLPSGFRLRLVSNPALGTPRGLTAGRNYTLNVDRIQCWPDLTEPPTRLNQISFDTVKSTAASAILGFL